MRRVVVTGMGAVTPIGTGVEKYWENVKKKTLGFGEITRFDTSDFKVKLAAEVKDFVAKEHMDFKAARRMELFCQWRLLKKHLLRQVWIWKRKIRFVWDVPLVQESAVCRQQRLPARSWKKKDRQESILCWCR